MSTDQLPPIHDVLIIGAGPCGLAVAARLRERTPSALYTDEEHRRFHWLAKHGDKSAVKDRKTGRVHRRTSESSPTAHLKGSKDPSVLVLDGEGAGWMTRWNRLFDAFGIEQLRSPMFFHPDPGDRDAMLGYAYEYGREKELEEIAGVVGKESSKHKVKKRKRLAGRCGAKAALEIDERDRKDYHTPSSRLFRDFCTQMIERYGLTSDLIRHESVESIHYGPVPALAQTDDLFTVRTSTGTHFARTVVLAVGAGNAPTIPACFPQGEHQAACHALHLQPNHHLPPQVRRKIRAEQPTNVAVIGGGLTSAQIADLAIRQGVDQVWLILRGNLRVKPFDVDLEWMGKFRNQRKAEFWMADDNHERAEMLRAARGGGSITPRFAKVVQRHVRDGRLAILTNTTVASQDYDSGARTWTLETDPPSPELPPIDYIYFATGVKSDASTLPFVQPMLDKHPVPIICGLPALTDDLAWSENVPLFVTGKFAGLRLGPGAANLEGARAGAERIALAIERLSDNSCGVEGRRYSGHADVNREEGGVKERYVTGVRSMFEGLEVES